MIGGFVKYTVEMVEIDSGSKTYKPSFVKISAGVKTILRFCLRNFRGFNVGITDVKALQSSR
jgi:uncharacterized protein YraI